MTIRAIVFDLFDTVVDLRMENLPRSSHRAGAIPASARPLYEALSEHIEHEFDEFAQHLVDVDRELFAERHAKGLELPTTERFGVLLGRLGLPNSELARRLTGVHMGLLREHVAVPSHHAEILRSLRHHVPLAICSNFSDSETAISILEEAGLREFFDPIVISEDVGVRKPRREIFDTVLDGLPCDREHVLHVGDNLVADVSGAAASGIRTGWLTRRVRDPEAKLARYEGPKPDWRFEDLSDLSNLIASDGGGRLRP